MKIIINEDKYNSLNNKYKLSSELYNNLSKHFTSLGNNEAFPSEKKYPFDYQIIKDRYVEIVDEFNSLNLPNTDRRNLTSLLSDLVTECSKIEKPNRDIFNKLCEKIIKETLYMPDDTILFRCLLTDRVEPKKQPRIMPEEDDEEKNIYTFNDVNEIDLTNKEVLKRRFLNSLVQGASYCLLREALNNYKDELFKIDDNLPQLYHKIIALNDYLLFQKEVKIDEKNPQHTAYVDVTLKSNGNKTMIEAQGTIFPFLVMEAFRGCCELFVAHGLPNDRNKMNYIIGKSDYMTAEQWDLRFGVKLWQMLSKGIEDTNVIPFFIDSISTINVDEFNSTMKEILSNTKKGNEILKSIIDDCYNSITYDDMPSDITTTTDNMRAVISDNKEEFFTLDEIKKLIKQV